MHQSNKFQDLASKSAKKHIVAHVSREKIAGTSVTRGA